MLVSDFHYIVPKKQIATHPPDKRGDSRLLVLGSNDDTPIDSHFHQLEKFLRSGDLLVLNDTQVLTARLQAHKETGGKVELLLERILDSRNFLARLSCSKPPQIHSRLYITTQLTLIVEQRKGEFYHLRIESDYTVALLLQEHGDIPLPPYLNRTSEVIDQTRYQTVFARHPGAVAAPTAGLHFTREMLTHLQQQNIQHCFVTLHVGSGTFQPIRGRCVSEHQMHSEQSQVTAETVAAIAHTRAHGGRIVAVGTTVVRCLETAAYSGTLQAFTGETDIFIYPPFEFKIIDVLLTNFHLPGSTLLMLVAAFAERERVLSAYRHAVAAGYHFFSYGDAMLLERYEI